MECFLCIYMYVSVIETTRTLIPFLGEYVMYLLVWLAIHESEDFTHLCVYC